jgi:hypothetical protein
VTYFWENPYVPNARGPSTKTIGDFLNLDSAQAHRLKQAISDAHDHESVDAALDLANELMGAHGVEAIRGDYHVDRYYFDTVALYVNTGDSYTGTLLYETDRDRFLVTSWGEWVERNERKYRIE